MLPWKDKVHNPFTMFNYNADSTFVFPKKQQGIAINSGISDGAHSCDSAMYYLHSSCKKLSEPSFSHEKIMYEKHT